MSDLIGETKLFNWKSVSGFSERIHLIYGLFWEMLPFPLKKWNEEKVWCGSTPLLKQHVRPCFSWHRNLEWTFGPQSCVLNCCFSPSTTCNQRKWPILSSPDLSDCPHPNPTCGVARDLLESPVPNHPKSRSESPLTHFKVRRHQVWRESQHIFKHTKWQVNHANVAYWHYILPFFKFSFQVYHFFQPGVDPKLRSAKFGSGVSRRT